MESSPADLRQDKRIDLTNMFHFGHGSAFGIEPPSQRSLLPPAAGCCASVITFCAHASGTHTECGAHILLEGHSLERTFETFPPFVECAVLKVEPERFDTCGGDTYVGSVPAPEGEELVVSKRSIEKALISANCSLSSVSAVAVLTLTVDWVFFTDQAMQFLVNHNIGCLIVDKISIDRERCGPKMPAHRIFFEGRPSAILTENIKQDASIKSGIYYLNLQLSPFLGTDAVPSRVLLFPKVS